MSPEYGRGFDAGFDLQAALDMWFAMWENNRQRDAKRRAAFDRTAREIEAIETRPHPKGQE